MGKFVPLETKKQVLKLFRQGLRSKKVSNLLGLNRSTVKEWQYLYDGGDTRWVTDKPINRVYRFTEKQRASIVKAYIDNALTMADLCRAFTIPKTVIKIWVRTFKKDGAYHCDTGAEEDKRARRTEQILQDLLCCSSGKRDRSSKKKILQAIERGKEAGLSVSVMLRASGIPRTDYYRWCKDSENKDQEIAARIKAIQETKDKHRQTYTKGAKKVAQLLRQNADNPIIVNHKKVARIMSEYALHAKVKVRKHPKDYYRIKAQRASNLPSNVLNRNFTASRPRQKLVTDITYIKIKNNQWCFLSAVEDLYNREIVSAVLSPKLDEKLVLDTIAQLKENIGSLNGVLIHSDQGWTYTNPRYIKLLKNEGAIQSLSRKGNCWDNAPMESFFSTFKSETIHRDDFYYSHLSYAEMVLFVKDYIYDYNNVRISKVLNWMPPVKYRKILYQFN